MDSSKVLFFLFATSILVFLKLILNVGHGNRTKHSC